MRRASRGCTRDPYPCCGAVAPQRPKSAGLCPECRGLIADGRRYREEAAQAAAAVYRFRSVDYALFYTSVAFESNDPLSRELQTAIFQMGQAISAPYHGPYVPDPPPLLDSDSDNAWESRAVVQAKPSQRDALSALVEVVRRCLAEARASGIRRGRSLLLGLASGDMSTTAFDAAVEKVQRR